MHARARRLTRGTGPAPVRCAKVGVAVAGVLAAAAIVVADDPRQPAASPTTFVESVEVTVVSIEVWVTGRDGEPVPGLRREDFEVRVDGRPVEISNFTAGPAVSEVAGVALREPADDGTPPAGGAGLSALTEERLHLVVVLDLESSRPALRRDLLSELAALVSHRPEGSRVMLATLEGDVTVRQRFSSDTAELESSLARLAEIPAGPGPVQSEARFLLRSIERTPRVNLQPRNLPGQAAGDSDFFEMDALALLDQVRSLAEREREWGRMRLRGLGRFVDALAGVAGRRALILAGGGIGTRPGEALLDAWVDRFPGLAQERNVVPASEAARLDLSDEVRTLAERANAGSVSIYTVDIGDPSHFAAIGADNPGSGSGALAEIFGQVDAQATFLRLADETGGLPLGATASGRGGLAGVFRDHESRYSLGFEPPGLELDHHARIEVSTRREGVRVRHRRAIERNSSDDLMASLTLASLYFDTPSTPLAVTVGREGPSRPDGKLWDVPVVVRVPLGNVVLLPEEDAHQGRLTVFLSVQDEKGRRSPVSAKPFPIRVANEALLTALGQYASFTFTLRLRSGPHRLAVTVRDELAAQASTAILDLDPEGA